jgi:23S rRNA (uracil1939-C5)-methyltransferase
VVYPRRERRSRPRSQGPRTPRHPRSHETPLPECRHFGVCGGCSSLDQPIAWQIQGKAARAEELLLPFLDGRRVEFELPERTPLHFRTKLLYPVRADCSGLAEAGIYAFRSHDLVRIEECRTQDRLLTSFGCAAERVLREMRLPPFDPRTGKGQVRAIQARLAAGSGELLVGVVTTPGVFEQGPELAERLHAAAMRLRDGRGRAPLLVGIVRSISEREDAFLLGDRHVPLRGRDHVQDRRDGLAFRVSAGSFYQVHRDASSLLYGPALRMCGDVRGQRVVDAYGGVGAFGLRFAKAGAERVEIVEDNAAACRDAEHNAKANQLPKVKVVRAPFATAEFAPGPDLLVVDPPRSGLQAAGVARVIAAKPRSVLHVACDLDSLVADVRGLVAGGYRVEAVRLCDLFPHTEHMELLAYLRTRTSA